jgi:hypothetical protein
MPFSKTYILDLTDITIHEPKTQVFDENYNHLGWATIHGGILVDVEYVSSAFTSYTCLDPIRTNNLDGNTHLISLHAKD